MKQNCTKPSNFKYHCLYSYPLRKLVEVCAVETSVHGKNLDKITFFFHNDNNNNNNDSNLHHFESDANLHFLVGGCLMYDTTRSKIQHLYDVVCGDFSTTCADTYMSTDAHLCEYCQIFHIR